MTKVNGAKEAVSIPEAAQKVLDVLREDGMTENEICYVLETAAKLAYPFYHTRLMLSSFKF